MARVGMRFVTGLVIAFLVSGGSLVLAGKDPGPGNGSGGATATDCSFAEIGKTWRLTADCKTTETIVVPDGYTLDGDGHTITAVEDSVGAWVGPIVTNGGKKAGVVNLILQTEGLECSCKGGAERLQGIRIENAQGEIRDNVILAINKGECPCQEGIGIVVSNAADDGDCEPDGSGGVSDCSPRSRVSVTGNMVLGFQKGGIVASGRVDVGISGNEVRGAGAIDYNAQNGIQVAYGAAGSVDGNAVADHEYSGLDDAIATGILVFETDSVTVRRNHLIDDQVGIAAEAWCYVDDSANDNRIENNNVDGSTFGISVAALAYDEPFSNCDASANNNRIRNNSVVSTDGEIGIFVGAEQLCDACAFVPEATGNVLARNRVVGFAEPIVAERAALGTTRPPAFSWLPGARARGGEVPLRFDVDVDRPDADRDSRAKVSPWVP